MMTFHLVYYIRRLPSLNQPSRKTLVLSLGPHVTNATSGMEGQYYVAHHVALPTVRLASSIGKSITSSMDPVN